MAITHDETRDLTTVSGATADIHDHEVDRLGLRLTYMDTNDLNVYVVPVNSRTGRIDSTARVVVPFTLGPGPGTGIPIDGRTNGVEWSRISTGVTRLYVSADCGTGFPEITRAEDTGSWSSFERINLPTGDNWYRWLINASASSVLDDRLLVYMKSRTQNAASAGANATICWFIDDSPTAVADSFVVDVPSTFARGSSPVRPAPDVYAVVYAVWNNTTGHNELTWVDFGAGGATRSTVLYTYTNAHAAGQEHLEVLSVGVNRAPNIGPSSFVVYVTLQAKIPPSLTQYQAGTQYCRIDSFVVTYPGPIGGPISAKGADPAALPAPRVEYGRSLYFDALVRVPRQERLFILDDENALDENGDPWLTLVLAATPYDVYANSSKKKKDAITTAVWVLPLTPDPPTAVGPPGAVLERQHVNATQGTDLGRVRWDAEPLLVNATDGIFVYYQQLDPGTGHPHYFVQLGY